MLQLAYISTAGQPHEAETLDAILAVSRRNNEADGVTGLLVAGGRRFLQALEGPEAAVLAAYARIRQDPRHRALVLLSCGTVTARAFGNWSMGFERGGSGGDATDLRKVVANLVAPLADRNLLAQFNGFADLHARAC
ncbi:BLUF domain-containing protein [Sphingosinicella terrae]|uniref:BLUF domain-containing protein n=1 Tax=Sphingosinicella terrae TaxID=2172047 RepID=UPI000E0CC19C|nr:BLUF domain-containing protein [Sphingosinicella terrae]